jgi:thymidylate synthase (FAD)
MIKVRAVGITTPLVDEIPDTEGLVSYSARVSNPSNQQNFDSAGGLLRYCIKHGHYSVFEMSNLIMEIEVPRDIARQILRHRSFSFQEFSQRYAKAFEFVERDARMQDTQNRQNSIDTDDEETKCWWSEVQEELIGLVQLRYEQALEKGIAKECARVILPEGNTMSRMYMNGTLRSWIHYVKLRNDPGVTQKEHVDVALACRGELYKHFPFLEQSEIL